MKKDTFIWFLLRLCLGWIFIWSFLDKLLGFGFATEHNKSWLNGGSSTAGFLKFGATGFLGQYYKSIAGNHLVDWLFMLGLLFVGFALLTGITLKLACYTGITLMILIYLALAPNKNNPIIDEHIIYSLVLLSLSFKTDHLKFSLYKYWTSLPIIKRFNFLH